MRIGILGSGQLGRMLALAGMPLGATFSFFDVSQGSPSMGLGEFFPGSFSDKAALEHFASRCEIITYEFENVPCSAANHLAGLLPVFPPPRALSVSQERVTEKNFFKSLELPGPTFVGVASLSELEQAISMIGTPCIVKTCRLGYDGKGQARITNAFDARKVWDDLGGVPLIVEEMIPFTRELSILGVRSKTGEVACYPLIENRHQNGILRRSEFPAPQLSQHLTDQARSIVTTTLHELGYVGVLAIELFEQDGSLKINEMAPRVHNSGHITQDAAVTSQFENHIRAIMGLPLGPTDARCRGVMLNILGQIPALAGVASAAQAKLHLYNKSEAPGRKLGHINLLDPSPVLESGISALLPC